MPSWNLWNNLKVTRDKMTRDNSTIQKCYMLQCYILSFLDFGWQFFTFFLMWLTVVFLDKLTFFWIRLHFFWKTEEEILRKIQSSFVVISWFICIFANVKAHASVSGRGQRHNGKRHWCFVFGYLKLPQIQINQSKA